MSLIFIDSFDDGLIAEKWTLLTNVVASTTSPRTGTHQASFEDSVNGSTGIIDIPLADQHATLILGSGYFQVADLPQAAATIFNFMGDAGATVHLGLRRNNDGSLTAYRGGNAGNNTGATTLATSAAGVINLGTWYQLEIKITLDDVTGVFEVRVDNVAVITFAGDTKNAGTGTVFDRVFAGSTEGADSTNMRLDDYYLLNGAGGGR